MYSWRFSGFLGVYESIGPKEEVKNSKTGIFS